MDEEDVAELEQILLYSLSTDNNEVEYATNKLPEILGSTECLDNFSYLMTMSSEPRARVAAAHYYCTVLKSLWAKMSKRSKAKHQTILVQTIDIADQNPAITSSCLFVISKIVSYEKKLWPELEQFIYQASEDAHPLRYEVIGSIIPYIPDKLIEENIEFYNLIVVQGFQSNDWKIVFNSMNILSILISVTPNPSTYINIYEHICTNILPNIHEANENDISKFFSKLEFIIDGNVFPNDVVMIILNLLQNQDLFSPEISIKALTSIQKKYALFEAEQIHIVLSLVIIYGNIYFNSNDDLNLDLIDPITCLLKYQPHELIYQLIKEQILISVENEITPITMLLILPIFNTASEQLMSDSQFVFELISAGLNHPNPLIIESVCTLIQCFEGVDCMIPYFPELTRMLIPFITNENISVHNNIYNALFQILLLQKVSMNSAYDLLWEKRDIVQDNIQDYVLLLGRAINLRESMTDEEIQQSWRYLQVYIKDLSDPMLTATTLYSLSNLIRHDEDLFIDILPNVLDAVKVCIEFNNEECKVRTLKFISEIAISYQDKSLDIISQFWPLIYSIVSNQQKSHSRVKEMAIETGCKIAKYVDPEITNEIAEALLLEIKKRPEIGTKCARIIASLIEPEQAVAFFTQIDSVLRNTDDEEIAKTSLYALKKLYKYCDDSNIPSFLQIGIEISQMFMKGEFQFMDGQSLIDQQNLVDIQLLDAFAEFFSGMLSYQAPELNGLCIEFLKLLEIPNEAYHVVVISVLLTAIENDNITQEIAQLLIDSIPRLMETATQGIQQNLVYLLNLLLQKYPDFITPIKGLMNILISWWYECLQNTEGCSMIIANLASLFLLIAVHETSFPVDFLCQVMDYFPPKDKTETLSMTNNIIQIMNIPEYSDINLRIKVGIAFGKLITTPTKQLSKLKLDQEMIKRVFIMICHSAQQISDSVLAEFQNFGTKTSILTNLLQ